MFYFTHKIFKKLSVRSPAQTLSELAIFGSILIFLVGVLIRQSLNFNFNQNQAIKAMRIALSESFKAGEKSPPEASRNVATVLYIEDRKTAEVNKFGTASRFPSVVSGSGTFTRNLFMPLTYGNDGTGGKAMELPVMDVFINGQYFEFTTAAFKTYSITGQYLFKQVPNVPSTDEYDPECVECFNLDRDPNPKTARLADGSPDVPVDLRADFSWQWKEIPLSKKFIDPDAGENTNLDVDGDLKEELILEFDITGGGARNDPDLPGPNPRDPHPDPNYPRINVHIPVVNAVVKVLDPHAGDIDLSYDTRDKRAGKVRPGVTSEAVVYTFNTDGTALKVQTIPDFHTSTQSIEQYDVIERKIHLSNDTGRICRQAEVCGDCLSDENIYKTCFEPDPVDPILYVRSRIKDLQSKVWVTPLTEE